MFHRRPTRKLLYPAGLLSLAILPLLGYQFYCSNYPIRNLKCMEVIYWDGKATPAYASPLPLIARTKLTRVTLDGSKDDEIKLAYAQVDIREMIRSGNSNRGFEFTFEETTSYSSLVRLFDICEIEGATRHLNHGDKFWVFSFDRKVNKESSPSGPCNVKYRDVYSSGRHEINLSNRKMTILKGNSFLIILSAILFAALIALQIRLLLA